MKTKSWTKLHVGSAVSIGIVLGMAAVYMTWRPVFAQAGAGGTETDAQIVALQKQKIVLLEDGLEWHEVKAAAGRITSAELLLVKVALAEARIDLAVLQAGRDTIAEQLRVILSLQEMALEDERVRFKAGMSSRRDLLELEVAAIDTRIRILQVEADDD